MRYTPLDEHIVIAGKVISWVPTAESLEQMENAPVDPRLPSVNQTQRMKYIAEHGYPTPGPWAGGSGLLLFGAEPSVGLAVERMTDRHETLRSRLVVHDDGHITRHTVEPGVVKYEPVVMGEFDDPADVARVINELFDKYTDPSKWPCMAVVSVENDVKSKVFVAHDHSNFDGYSGFVSGPEFIAITGDINGGTPAKPPAASFVDFADAENRYCETVTADDERVLRWKSVADYEQGVLAAPPAAAGVNYAEEPPEMKMGTWEIASSDEVVSYLSCMRSLASANDNKTPDSSLLMALFVSALADGQPGEFMSLFSTHNRPEKKYYESIGWFASVAPLHFEVEDPSDLVTLAQRMREAVTSCTPCGELPLPTVARLLDHPGEPGMVLSFIDGTKFPDSGAWELVEAAGHLGQVPNSHQIHVWLANMPWGFALEARYPVNGICHEWLQTVANRMGGLLQGHMAIDLTSEQTKTSL